MFLRWLLLLAIIVMSAAVQAFTVVPLKENGLPEGDYEAKGCYQCENTNNKLTCQCPYSDEQFYKRTLDLNLCDPLVVTTINGLLRCLTDINKVKKLLSDYSGSGSGSGSGQYEDSFEEEVLTDELPPPLFEDVHNELPEGDYRSYCKECKIEDGSLTCECKVDGWFFPYWYEATLPLQSCQSANEVTYMGGLLYCSHAAAIKDNAVKGCTGCKLQGNTLYCKTCEQTTCGWSNEDLRRKYHVIRHVKLAYVRDCTKKITNCNGKLRCGGCWPHDFYDETVFFRPKTEGTDPAKYCHPDKPTPWQ